MRAAPAPATESTVLTRFRVLLDYAVTGDLRFLSHHDELRLLARALTRAAWPLRYSQGFNPLPRITVPLPRSAGTAALRQLALVELCEEDLSLAMIRRLQAALPSGCALYAVHAPAPAAVPHPRSVVYELPLPPGELPSIDARLERVRQAGELWVDRVRRPDRPARRFDVRPYLTELSRDGDLLRLRVQFVQQRTARPVEVLTVLDLPAADHLHRLRRGEVEWDIELPGPSVRPGTHVRNNIGEDDITDEEKPPA